MFYIIHIIYNAETYACINQPVNFMCSINLYSETMVSSKRLFHHQAHIEHSIMLCNVMYMGGSLKKRECDMPHIFCGYFMCNV